MSFPFSLGDPPEVQTPDPYLVPVEFLQGDTFSFRVRDSRYLPADGWTLQFSARGGRADGVKWVAGTAIDLFSTADGQDHVITGLAADTAGWLPGQYSTQVFAIKDPERYRIQSGSILILPDLSISDASTDTRSHNQRVLDCINAILEGRATDDILDTHIGDTEFRRLTPAQLLVLKNTYVQLVRQDEAKANVKSGRASGRRILTRFTRV